MFLVCDDATAQNGRKPTSKPLRGAIFYPKMALYRSYEPFFCSRQAGILGLQGLRELCAHEDGIPQRPAIFETFVSAAVGDGDIEITCFAICFPSLRAGDHPSNGGKRRRSLALARGCEIREIRCF
jgi:hypothetical protein